MKNEKSLKTKKIALVSIIVVFAVSAITLMSIFLPKQKKALATQSAKTAEALKNNGKTVTEIENLEAEYQKSFDANANLWEKYFAELQKLDEIAEEFDEKAFIKGLTTLTDEEKATLLQNVEALDELDAKLDKLYNELFDLDEDMPYNGCEGGSCGFSENGDNTCAGNGCEGGSCGEYDVLFIECDETFFGDNLEKVCDEAELKNDQIQALKKEFDEVMNARADLWEKVYNSYDELDENFDFANFDEVKYIADLSVLSADEKDALIKDLAKLDEISEKLVALCKANCGK